MTTQRTEGAGKQPEHTHPAATHTHDHYHVSHHHKGGVLTEWEHRTYWHTHEHNHNAVHAWDTRTRRATDKRAQSVNHPCSSASHIASVNSYRHHAAGPPQ
jgi:hypothetical protein